jgi:hypothetical protein
MSSGLWSKAFSLLLTRNFVKASKQKITGKTGGDALHGERKSRT